MVSQRACAAVVLVVALGVAGEARPAVPTFAEPIVVRVGSAPELEVARDLNADGRLDLVTTDYGDGTVSVLLNQGMARFTSTQYEAAGATIGADAGDVDADGNVDLLVGSQGEEPVLFFRGRGDGTFPLPDFLEMGDSPHGVRLGDLNQDGVLDVVVGNGSGPHVAVALGQPAQPPGPTALYRGGSSANDVALADVNGDGALDVAAALYENGRSGDPTVSILLGDGKGGLRHAAFLDTGSNANSVEAGDLDRDGHVDLVTANYGSQNVGVLLGLGAGRFARARSYPLRGVADVAIGDVNSDGIPDLVADHARRFLDGGSAFAILLGRGDGTFRRPIRLRSGFLGEGVVVDDLTNDGRPDIAVGSFGDDTVWIYVGDAAAERCRVPSLRGMRLQAARRALTRAHCGYGGKKRVESGRRLRERVVRANPKAGSVLPTGAPVELALGASRKVPLAGRVGVGGHVAATRRVKAFG